jgi:hypothetical protein
VMLLLKLLEDAEIRSDPITRRDIIKIVILFLSVTTQCSLSGESPEGQGDKSCSLLLEGSDLE